MSCPLNRRDLMRALRSIHEPSMICRESKIGRALNVARDYVKERGELSPRAALQLTGLAKLKGETRLRVIDVLTQCHGVESFESYNGQWSYANTGDSYAETVLLSPGGRFIVASWGDIVESESHRKWSDKQTCYSNSLYL